MTARARVTAGPLTRVYELDGGPPRPVGLELSGRWVPLAGAGAGPSVVLDGQLVDPAALDVVHGPSVDEAAGNLSWTGLHRATSTELRTTVTADETAGVVRTTVEVRGHARLGTLVVESWTAPDTRGPSGALGQADLGHVELGQPVFGTGWFAGVEHPGAENRSGPGPASFALPLDVDLTRGDGRAAVSLVVGCTPVGRELDGFWDYLDGVRARPPGLVVLANNWYQLGYSGLMDQATVAAELEGFADVARRHGLALDHYCLDDPWDGGWEAATGLWGRLDPARFPGGLPALVGTAGPGSEPAGIGLWVSPWGGYFDRHDQRVEWGRTHGYEVKPGDWACLCPAGTVYRDHLMESLGRWAAKGVGYWKLDGVQFDCTEADHGHVPASGPTGGPGGRTDQMDRLAGLLDAVRAANPASVIAFTTGSNPSPWWLRHADFLWRGGYDDEAPAEFEGPAPERFDTYIDSCLDALRPAALPVSAIVTFSLVENQARAYREPGQGPQAWARHCWLLAGRGGLHHDLYVAPGSLSAEEWDVLATTLAWARRHQRVLARSRMVGGQPHAGEVYGFVSAHQGDVCVCLRNPSASPLGYTLRAADLGGTAADLRFDWGGPGPGTTIEGMEEMELELRPFQVLVLSGELRQ